VRKQYLVYLERQLQENVNAWAGRSRNHHKPTAWNCIPQSVKLLEEETVKVCMVAHLYQRAMIAMVRRSTQEGRLANIIFNQMQNPLNDLEDHSEAAPMAGLMVDKATQTSSKDFESVSSELSRKIDLFQAGLEELEEAKGDESLCTQCSRKNKSSPSSPLAESEDALARELATICGDDRCDLNEIFGIEPNAVNDDPQTVAILKEIDNAELPERNEDENLHTPIAPPSPGEPQSDLRASLWPCELYAQRKRLNACLIRLLEANWRCEDSLRHKFHQLFGEDSDNEFETLIASPSIELADEVLLGSCVHRIRPWIVRHLMCPLEDGLIANRFLFKKLAKRLAHSIVMVNAYCSEQQVKDVVEHLFCLRPQGIRSAYDLNSLPPLDVDKFEV
ncbi:hypothetical protein KR018_011781, partial [Drosophila ironensis]